MNIRKTPWLTIIITATVGIMFVIWHSEVNLFDWLVRALGLALTIPGAYLLFNTLSSKNNTVTIQSNGKRPVTLGNRSSSVSLIIVSAVTILLGIWMLAVPSFFVGLIAYLFAAALLVYGAYQLITVAYLCRPVTMPWYYYLVPTLTMLAGLVIIFTPVHTMNTIVTLTTGLLLIFAAANWTMQRIAIHNYLKNTPVPESHRITETSPENEA